MNSDLKKTTIKNRISGNNEIELETNEIKKSVDNVIKVTTTAPTSE